MRKFNYALLLILVCVLSFTNVSAKTIEDHKLQIKYNITDETTDKLKVVFHFRYDEEDKKLEKNVEKYNRKLSKLIDLDGDFYHSYAMPFIEVEMEYDGDVDKFDKKLQKFIKYDFIVSIYVGNEYEMMVPEIFSSTQNFWSDQPYDNTTSYQGYNIDVGILDGGLVDATDYNFQNVNVYHKDYALSDVAIHATMVASIAVGTQGIVTSADIYSAKIETSSLSEWDDALMWMDSNGVDVINMSLGFDTNGMYSSIDAYVDYFVANYRITVVAAAGNYDASEGYYVASPALGLNVITVGNLRNSSYLETDSAYNESSESHHQKPTLVAIGQYSYEVPGGNICQILSGTSFSAPAVTGTIAAMMQKRGIIKWNPSQATAILTAHADMDNLTAYNDFTYKYEEKVGAGELDVVNSINNVWNSSYGYVNTTDSVNSIVGEKLIHFDAYDIITISLFWETYATYDSITNQVNSYYPINLDLQLRHLEDGIYCTSTSSSYNFETIDCLVYSNWDYNIEVLLKQSFNTTAHGSSRKFAYAWDVN